MMISGFALLLAFQFAGEIIKTAFSLPIPGAVMGMAMLLIAMLIHKGLFDVINLAASALISNLALLLVPAGVGIGSLAGLLIDDFIPLSAALLISTAFGIATTAIVMQTLGRNVVGGFRSLRTGLAVSLLVLCAVAAAGRFTHPKGGTASAATQLKISDEAASGIIGVHPAQQLSKQLTETGWRQSLIRTPAFHVLLTLSAYLFALNAYRMAGCIALLNPLLISVGVVVATLAATHTPYDVYYRNTSPLSFLLGPATVALAVPLFQQLPKMRGRMVSVFLSILAGSVAGATSAVAIVFWLGGSYDFMLSIAPKSVTTPVGMAISEGIGGMPPLTAILVILTGLIGFIIGPTILDRLQVNCYMARGLALGTASHMIGTTRAFQENEVSGAFSGLALGTNALLTAIVLPVVWQVLTGSGERATERQCRPFVGWAAKLCSGGFLGAAD